MDYIPTAGSLLLCCSALPNKDSFPRDFRWAAWVLSSFKNSHVSPEELLCIRLSWKAGPGGEWLSF